MALVSGVFGVLFQGICVCQVELSHVCLCTSHMLQSHSRKRHVLQECHEHFPKGKFRSSQLALPVGTNYFKSFFSFENSQSIFSQPPLILASRGLWAGWYSWLLEDEPGEQRMTTNCTSECTDKSQAAISKHECELAHPCNRGEMLAHKGREGRNRLRYGACHQAAGT